MKPRVLIFAVLILVLTGMRARAEDPKLPNGANCQMVRDMVVRYGKVSAIGWAIRNGYTFNQIRLAQRCLGR